MVLKFLSMAKTVERKKIIFWAFIIVYSAVLIFLANKLNIWEDEAYSLHTTAGNLNFVIKQSYNFEDQPPFYFLILALWRQLNSGILFARFLSLIFIGGGAYFFYRIVCLISGFQYSRWLVVIFLLNPFTVWAGLEIRLYALVIFLSAISIYAFLRFYIEDKIIYLYLFLLISTIGLYTQYFFLLQIASMAFMLLIFKGWKSFFRLCIYTLPVIILFLPNLFFMHQQVTMVQSHKLEYNISYRILAIAYALQELLLAIPIVPDHFELRFIIRALFIFIATYAYIKIYRRQSYHKNNYFKKINFIFLSAAVLIFLYTLLFLITGIIFQSKYMAIAFPLLMLIFILFKIKPFNSHLVYTIISIYFISLLFINFKHPIKNYDFIAAGKFIQKIERKEEPILFYSKSLLPPFSYYYSGYNVLVPIPFLKYDDHYYDENIRDTSQLKKAIEKVSSPNKSYLLITDSSSNYKYDINMKQQMVDDCLKANYIIEMDTLILGKNKNNKLSF